MITHKRRNKRNLPENLRSPEALSWRRSRRPEKYCFRVLFKPYVNYTEGLHVGARRFLNNIFNSNNDISLHIITGLLR